MLLCISCDFHALISSDIFVGVPVLHSESGVKWEKGMKLGTVLDSVASQNLPDSQPTKQCSQGKLFCFFTLSTDSLFPRSIAPFFYLSSPIALASLST
jgi:hypothetical protein